MSYAEVPKEQPAPAEQAQEPSSQKTGYSVSTTKWDANRSFKQEIPEELTNEKLVGNGLRRFNFFSRIVRDKYRWGKVEKDADDVDNKATEEVIASSDKNKVKTATDSVRNLNKDCFEYISKNQYTENIAQEKVHDAKQDNISKNSKEQIADRFNVAVKLISKGESRLNILSGKRRESNLFRREDILRKEKKTISETGFVEQKENFDIFNTGNPKSSDCLQERLGDCWWQSGIISLLQTPDGKEKIKEMFTDLGGGKVLVRLYEPSKIGDEPISWNLRNVIVEKKIPSECIYNKSDALWVHLLQQAMVITDIRNKYFEMRGEEKRGKNTKKGNTYKVMTGGNSNLAWHTILGDSANLNTVKKGEFNEKYEKNNVDQFYDKIKNAVSSSKAVTISFDKKAHTRKSKNNSGTGQVGNSGEHIDRGLVFNHAYTVVDCTEESGIKYIWLINPWSSRKGVEYDKNTGKRNEKIKGYSINEQNKDGRFKLKARTAFRYLYDFDILNFYL